jgi:hypothetical protein
MEYHRDNDAIPNRKRPIVSVLHFGEPLKSIIEDSGILAVWFVVREALHKEV